jgi:hypothetical protein
MGIPKRLNIFICYRRNDTAPSAGRLYDRLSKRFGHEHVFMDIDTVMPGDDFIAVIEEKIASCDVALVLIGLSWLGERNAGGQQRINRTEDFVRLEIASALKHGVLVIPVLIDGTPMPTTANLPDDLAPLARRHALEIRNNRFNEDVNRLVESIVRARYKKRTHATWQRLLGWTVVVALIVMVAIVGFKLRKLLDRQQASISEANAPKALQQDKWAGSWQYVCETKQGMVQGKMRLKIVGKTDVVGEYNDTIASGSIEGIIGEHSESLTETWNNARGQVGKFRFILSPEAESFEGHYSMSPTSSPPEYSNKWSGSRK